MPISSGRGVAFDQSARVTRPLPTRRRGFALPRREAGFSRGSAGPAGAARSAETGIVRCQRNHPGR
jgi:hypothetical protein